MRAPPPPPPRARRALRIALVALVALSTGALAQDKPAKPRKPDREEKPSARDAMRTGGEKPGRDSAEAAARNLTLRLTGPSFALGRLAWIYRWTPDGAG